MCSEGYSSRSVCVSVCLSVCLFVHDYSIPANYFFKFSWTLGTIFRDSQEFSGINGSAMDPELLALILALRLRHIYKHDIMRTCIIIHAVQGSLSLATPLLSRSCEGVVTRVNSTSTCT